MYEKYIIQMLIAGTVLFVVFALFLICFILYMRSRQNLFNNEQKRLSGNREGKIEECERFQNEISKRVHDEILQNSFVVRMHLRSVMKGMDEKQAHTIDCVLKSVDDIIESAQKVCFTLNGDFIKSYSLERIVETELERVSKSRSIDCRVDSKGEPRVLNAESKVIAFRIAHEAIQNIVKHAGASSIDVLFDYHRTHFLMQIKDDGNGFSSEKLHAQQTIGLPNMYQRAKFLNAELNIESIPGSGCMVSLLCPG